MRGAMNFSHAALSFAASTLRHAFMSAALAQIALGFEALPKSVKAFASSLPAG